MTGQRATIAFYHEFEKERGRRLRRRFLLYCGLVLVATWVLITVRPFSSLAQASSADWRSWVPWAVIGLRTVLFGAAFVYLLLGPRPREAVIRLAIWLIILSSTLSLIVEDLVFTPGPLTEFGLSQLVQTGALSFTWYVLACLVLPMTAREALRALVPLVAVYAAATLIRYGADWRAAWIWIALSPLPGLAGVLVCWIRYHRLRQWFRFKFLRQRYSELGQELTDARRIHESLFPKPVLAGSVRLTYVYEPAREVGGDYLFLHRPESEDGDDDGPLSLVVLDVNGHGIASALAVNRLSGELERLYAEEPDIAPGQVIERLNRYFELTLARHAIYGTAFCLRVTPSEDLLEWANAGHPPAVFCGADGALIGLDSTAPVLGAMSHKVFKADAQQTIFRAGDRLICYTDGATDARNSAGMPLRVAGFAGLVREALARESVSSASPGGKARQILEEVERYRSGPPDDDMLIVELSRSLWVHRPMKLTKEAVT
jgi:serine phosphatase RsbU (regulator of sigma subunit)